MKINKILKKAFKILPTLSNKHNLPSHLHNFSTFQHFQLSYHTYQLEQNRLQEQKLYQDWDTQIKNLRLLQNQNWKIHSRKSKTLLTLNGKITFISRWYKKTTNQKTTLINPLYHLMNLSPHERISKLAKIHILQNFLNGTKSYASLVANLPHFNISKQSVSNIIKHMEKIFNFNLHYTIIHHQDLQPKFPITSTLHLFIDDTFKTFKAQNFTQTIRTLKFCTHQNKHKQLINKTIFTFFPKHKQPYSSAEMTTLILNKIKTHYSGKLKNITLFFHSDGARTFKTIRTHLTKFFKQVIYIYDKWHAYQWINQTFPPLLRKTHKLNFHLKNLFSQGKTDNLFLLLKKLSKYSTNYKILKLYHHFLTQKDGIINQNHPQNFGSSQESDTSFIKNQFGFGNKLYNLSTFQKILNIKLSQINYKFSLIPFLITKSPPNHNFSFI